MHLLARAVLRSEVVILSSFRKVALHSLAMLIHKSKIKFRIGALWRCGFLEPEHGSLVVNRDSELIQSIRGRAASVKSRFAKIGSS